MTPLGAVVLLLLFGGPKYGQGGVAQVLKLKGRDGTAYTLTFYRDHTRKVETSRVLFYVREPRLEVPIAIARGTKAQVKAAIDNYPE